MPNNYKFLILFSFFGIFLTLAACKPDEGPMPTEMTLEEERDLGRQMRDAINNAPEEYPVLEESYYQKSYDYLYTIYQTMQASAPVTNYNTFDWEIYIIEDDNVRDAFMLPGGYLYIYTGLLKYMSSENQLAALLSYEIKNADAHFTKIQLEAEKSLSFLLDVAQGDDLELALNLVFSTEELVYTPDQVKEADLASISTLCNSSYRPNGILHILERAVGDEIPPTWVQTEPVIQERFAWIQGKLGETKCEGDVVSAEAYMQFLMQLP